MYSFIVYVSRLYSNLVKTEKHAQTQLYVFVWPSLLPASILFSKHNTAYETLHKNSHT